MKRQGLSPKTRMFVDKLVKVADDNTLDHLIGAAEAYAEDALIRGDMDEHMQFGEAFHLMRSEKARRQGHLYLEQGE
jgi:hypothetical protein